MPPTIPRVEVTIEGPPFGQKDAHFHFYRCTEELVVEVLVRVTTHMAENTWSIPATPQGKNYLKDLAQRLLIDMFLRAEIWQDYQGTWQLEKS